MKPLGKKRNYLLAAVFWLIGLFYLGIGGRDIASCLAAGAPLTSSVVAFAFLALFAWASIAYGFFLFREAKAGPAPKEHSSVVERVHPAEVLGLLAFGVAPVVFIFCSASAREFNVRREAAFQELRPAFLRYVAEHGKPPRRLQMLIPEYLPALPPAIILAEDSQPSKRVQYVPMKQTARLYYRSGGWPDSTKFYDIGNDRYED